MKRPFLAAISFLLALSFDRAGAGDAPAPKLSPAQQKIAWARKAIEKNPERHSPRNDLALALARRARETSDTAYYDQAEDALRESFRITPDNFEGKKVLVWVLLGKHEFARARDEAQKLQKRAPDDVLVYGFLTDANVELGNYKEAEEAAQWMLDIRPGNLPGLTRAAYLRELFGDLDGAVELMDTAYQRTSPTEVEDRAWILTQIGHLHLVAGKADVAEKVIENGLELFPGYHYALAQLAKVRAAQGKHDEAAKLLARRYIAAPHAENLFDLAEALELAGKVEESKADFIEFEKKSRTEMGIADNSNHELIRYYADHAQNPAEALRIARLELERRHDVHTLDALAWALWKNGQAVEAREKIEAALSVGTRDPRILAHARAIGVKEPAKTAAGEE